MVDKHTRADEVAVEDDFEWVNAWAASRQAVKTPAAAEASASPLPGPQMNHAVAARMQAPAPAGTAVADEPVVPLALNGAAHAKATISEPAAASIQPTAEPESSDRAQPQAPAEAPAIIPSASAETAEPAPADADASDADGVDETVAVIDAVEDTAGEPAPIPLFETARRLGRARWRNIFRLAARVSEPPSHPMLVAPDGPSEPVADMQALPEVTDAEVVLAPDQLERDIAEIEIVRDRLLAEHAADQRQRVAGRSMARTSDYVPILVGGALAFTLLVVFGAAASFVSLR
jgi:hypothetical protein